MLARSLDERRQREFILEAVSKPLSAAGPARGSPTSPARRKAMITGHGARLEAGRPRHGPAYRVLKALLANERSEVSQASGVGHLGPRERACRGVRGVKPLGGD